MYNNKKYIMYILIIENNGMEEIQMLSVICVKNLQGCCGTTSWTD